MCVCPNSKDGDDNKFQVAEIWEKDGVFQDGVEWMYIWQIRYAGSTHVHQDLSM